MKIELSIVHFDELESIGNSQFRNLGVSPHYLLIY